MNAIVPPNPQQPVTDDTSKMRQVFRTWTQIVSRVLGAIPTGGTAGQALTKIDSDDFNTQWSTVGGGGGSPLTQHEESFIATASQTNFALSSTPEAAWVWQRGAAQDASVWSISGNDIVLATGATVGDEIEIYYLTGGGGTGQPLDVEDEGISLSTDVTKINFIGAGVVATEPVSGEIDVTISGGGGGAVSSVFGRVGAVNAVSGDYTAAQVTNAFDKTVDDSDNITEGAANLFFSVAEETKLSGIEIGATTDQTGADIKALYDTEPSAFTDGQFSKLSGIETGATADQTGVEIKSLYEAETSAFTDAQFTKLAGIATGAQVNAVDTVNTQSGTVVLDADDISDTSTTNKYTTAGEITKLSGIEALADVTDAPNVTNALDGATISAVTVAAGDKVFIQDISDSDNLKTVTAQSIADLGGGGGSFPNYALFNITAGTSINAVTFVNIDMTATAVTDSGLSLSSGQVTVINAGTYEILGFVGITGTTGNYRYAGETVISVNGATPSTFTGIISGYLRAASGHNENALAVLDTVVLSASDTLDIMVRRDSTTSGNATTTVTSRIAIRRVK